MHHRDHNYRTQAARDLAWALTSPSLLDHPKVVDQRFGELEFSRNQGLLSRLDATDSALVQAIKGRQSDRLGEYFEILMTSWLDQVPPAELIAANKQVHRGGRTVGEFDLLFRRDRAVHHWELAIKFYLGHPAPDGSARWYGPNPKDQLHKKWSKMLRRQLRLSQTQAGRKTLRKLGVDEGVEARAFIKGYFFEPLDDEYRVAHHSDTNPSGLRGWWVHRGQLADFEEELDPAGERRWMTLTRLRWMSPARITDRDKVRSFETLHKTLPDHRHFLVSGLEKTDQGWREVTRGFVVPDRWPG